MSKELWLQIEKFEFDNPPGEYCFSIRLAHENSWTKNFTDLAILEYKKFMFLAAISDKMVSPSEIVDIVWHQHLIFTQSYNEFCALLGKQIQHIPSTHDKGEFEKFKAAKERTKTLYNRHFGAQPASIWEYETIFDSLNLQESKFKIEAFLSLGLLVILVLIYPLFLLLEPVYQNIKNPSFLIGFIGLAVLIFSFLEIVNRSQLRKITTLFSKDSFVFNLHPLELIYFKTQDLSHPINGVINELITKKRIHVNKDYTIELLHVHETKSKEQFQTTTTLSQLGKVFYPALLKELVRKAVFSNIENHSVAFKKHLGKSKNFYNLFALNFIILSTFCLFGFIRLLTGITHEKPVLYLSITLITLGLLIVAYLQRLTKLIFTTTIPKLYLNKNVITDHANTPEWEYFRLGKESLVPCFLPLVVYTDRNRDSSYGSSCGGSSCGGGGCGGCGGCGGG